MKRILSALCLLVISTLTVANDERPAPTPLQLKMMQTRIFKKSPNTVMSAIKTNMEDAGATMCAIVPIEFDTDGSQLVNSGTIQCHFPYKQSKSSGTGAASALAFIPFVGGIAASAMIQSDLAASQAEQEKQIRQISYDVSSQRGVAETTVRMRITLGLADQKQATFPETYDSRFKAIADSLFIEALPVKAATQD